MNDDGTTANGSSLIDENGTAYVYAWADGIHLRIRLQEAKANRMAVLPQSLRSSGHVG
ncbi:hypothetical protein ACFV8T_30035 [Streptomyces sp. NPDC059832]|uniref:hypothetical protein n=1 Tax=unclassified Streptomyces TaxID=2593676 RepID=UPI003646899C